MPVNIVTKIILSKLLQYYLGIIFANNTPKSPKGDFEEAQKMINCKKTNKKQSENM